MTFEVTKSVRRVRELLVEASRRHSRVAHESEDLAHDIIVSALRRGVALDDDAFLRSVHGAARRHGAFVARSAGRRRAREMLAVDASVACRSVDTDRDTDYDGAPVSVLSSSLQTTLLLMLQGLDKAELRLALGVTDAALRKRFQALRKRGPLARPPWTVSERTPTVCQVRRSQVSVLPRLGAVDRLHAQRALAASDPDGHGLIFFEVLTPSRRAATTGASPTNARMRAKGNPCSTLRSATSPSSS